MLLLFKFKTAKTGTPCTPCFAHQRGLRIDKEVGLGVIVRSLLAGGPVPQVEGVGKHRPRQGEAARAGEAVHLVKQRLAHGVPRLVVLHVAVVGVVGAVGDAPAVVGHQDRRVHDVAHKVVQALGVGKRLVAAAGQGSGVWVGFVGE